MLEKTIEHVRSRTAYKRACIFFLAFVITVTAMGGSHDIFYGSSVTSTQKTEVSSTSSLDGQAEEKFADVGLLAAKKSSKLDESESVKAKADESDKNDTVTVKSSPKDEEDADIEANADEAETKQSTKESDAKAGEPEADIVTQEAAEEKVSGFKYSDQIPMIRDLQEFTYNKCQERGLEYELVLAIIWRESNFTINAVHVNSNGTRDNGIMQINDVNRKWLRDNYGITDLMDPYQNIDAGTAMLGRLTKKYGSHNAMLAYQYGEGGMAKKLKQGITTSHATEKAYQRRDYYRQILQS